jgi:hypothetical protein
MTDGRERGEWRQTPVWLFWKPRWRRPVYAYGALGGGLDEWEYAATIIRGQG